jgi:AAA+ ATPase superfamily predicted ATPase
MRNPFYFRELPLDAPFCNRTDEIKELVSHAYNKANVVLYSPRRYGKTSLVKRVQNNLKNKGITTLYADFYGVDSVEDLSARLAACVYEYSRNNDTLLKKIVRFLTSWRPVLKPDPESGVTVSVVLASPNKGIALLDDTFKELHRFMNEHDEEFCIAFDEFQELTELRESSEIEGLMRSHIQQHSKASYFFIGSRRRILKDIFNDRARPFYQSSINYYLGPLPENEAIEFIINQFKKGGKSCPEQIVREIIATVRGYPYYIQRIPYSIFEVSDKEVTEKDYIIGLKHAIEEERPVYEAVLQGLSLQQTKLISALAGKPTDKPYSNEYMARYSLGSVGGVQGALKRLLELDYIEKIDKEYYVVDPVFGIWLKHLKGYI